MRTAVVFIVTLAAFAAAVPVLEEQKEYPRFIKFSDDEGDLHTVDLQEEPDHELLEEIEKNPNNQYLLFTRDNPTTAQELILDDVKSIINSNFNPKNPIVVVAHGWLSNQDANLNPTIRDAFLGKSDTNVIVLDWRHLAVSGYVTAVSGVPAVGRGLAQFLRFLRKTTRVPYSSMHLVGFSLGAHLVGNAGKELGGAVARITGLDPSGPLWTLNSNRLSSDDAVYVEVIHTDGSYSFDLGLGIGISIGDVDFFPNGGDSQPGCLTSICSHNRAWQFFAATVTYDHLVGRECSNILQLTLGTCRGERLNMGNDDLRKSGSGRYRLSTKRRYPY